MSNRNRCAIYTRKSSEEGLEQSFNSLDAQREACLAYIKSQQHDGWQAIPHPYDDGGFSGGNTERPAFKQLMADILAGKVSTVVVYKVDRLTRSLADFARIIEQFDKHGVSFVSVTQQFNTTTSMGRLTLNVLLSFAQFEREVTGERIRDKVAASKQKGIWMGGSVPLGYQVRDRMLLVEEAEASSVRSIFHEFLRIGNMTELRQWLREKQIRSRRGHDFYSGPLYAMLRNPIYIGMLKHKKNVYPGQHAAIVDRQTWEAVQSHLDSNARRRQRKTRSTKPSLLMGIIFDTKGMRYTPSHANKDGKRYRYYASQAVIQKVESTAAPARLPAAEIEKAINERLLGLLNSPVELIGALKQDQGAEDQNLPGESLVGILRRASELAASWAGQSVEEQDRLLKELIFRVVVHSDHLEIQIRLERLLQQIMGTPASEPLVADAQPSSRIVSVSCGLRHVRQGKVFRLVVGNAMLAPDSSRHAILRALALARNWYQKIVNGEAVSLRMIILREGVDPTYAKKVFPLAFLSPAATEAILRFESDLTLTALLAGVENNWALQKSYERA